MVLADDVTAGSREAEAVGWSMRAKVVASLVALCCVACSVALFARASVVAALFASACMLLGVAVLAYARGVFRRAVGEGRLLAGSLPLTLTLALGAPVAGAVLLEALTVAGTPGAHLLSPASWSKLRLLLFWLCCVGMTALAYRRAWERGASACDGDDRPSRPLPVRWGLASLAPTCLVPLGAAAALSGAWSWSRDTSGERLVFLALCVAVAVVLLVVLRRTLREHVEYAVLVVILSMGTFLCFAMPPVTAISWDDQIHFDNALGLSYVTSPHVSEPEQELVAVPWVTDSILDYDEMERFLAEEGEPYAEHLEDGTGDVVASGSVRPVSLTSLLNIVSFGSIPSAVGLWLARLLGLPLAGMVVCGRFFNLLFYALMAANAVRIIPARKVLMGLVAMLPTSIFLASNYSKDPWVTAWIMLGVSQTMREFSRRDERLTPLDAAKCVIPLVLGLFPKAVYFPVLGILLLMPRERFATRRGHALYLASVVAVALFVISTFVMPLLFPEPGAADGDWRGGEGVSSSGQIRYVLSHPLEFCATMARYMGETCLSPAAAGGYTLHYAYFSHLPGSGELPFALVVITAVFDQRSDERLSLSLPGRVWVVVTAACAVFLSVVALYVSFTPVGLGWVNGWQPRYLIPMLFPLLMAFEFRLPAWCERLLPVVLAGAIVLSCYCDVSYVVFL